MKIEIGKVFRIKPRQIGGYDYAFDYRRGLHIHVKIISGPKRNEFLCTTRGDDGEHLGPGGGWHGKSLINLTASDLEEIPAQQ